MAHEPGYTCVFPYMCSERGTPLIAGGWFDHPGLHVPADSMDMVFHAQGLHHIPPGSDRATYFTVFDKFDHPLRPGGWLHLSDGNYPGQTDWMGYLREWAAKRGYVVHRKQDCKHIQHLLQKPWKPKATHNHGQRVSTAVHKHHRDDDTNSTDATSVQR